MENQKMEDPTVKEDSFHILVIDDESAVRLGFEQFLTKAGYRVTSAEDGREGMSLMRKQPPDLIITDIMMPEMDGLEILMEINKLKLNIPVITISGGMKTRPASFLPQAKRFGASRVFSKPVNLPELLTAIQELLAGAAVEK